MDFADDVALLAEMLSVLVLALEVMNEEVKPLGLTINWAKTKIQTTDTTVLPGTLVQVGGSSVEIVDIPSHILVHNSIVQVEVRSNPTGASPSLVAVCRCSTDTFGGPRFQHTPNSGFTIVYTASVSLRSRNMVNNQRHREKDQRPRSVVSSAHTEHYVVRSM